MNQATYQRTNTVEDGDEKRIAGVSPLPTIRKDALLSSLSVLPVAAAQLQEVSRHVEESVVKVCGSFQDMIERARQATSQTPLIDDSDKDPCKTQKMGINHLIADTRETMSDLLKRIEHTSDFSGQMVEKLNAMERQTEELKDTLTDIDAVAKNSRLLALNGQLEAARAGEQGAAFAIVATETAKMAVHAVDSSKKLRRMIGTISESINGASVEIKNRATTDVQETAQSRKEVDHSLDAMSLLHVDMQKAIDQSHDNCQELARDISEAVMAMQFQDAVNQRIEHVVHLLLELHDVLSKQLNEESCPALLHETHENIDWAHRMAGKYTMAAEHKVLAAHRGARAVHKTDFGDNVELF
jgi:methyl-accepting chemotaxis protein